MVITSCSQPALMDFRYSTARDEAEWQRGPRLAQPGRRPLPPPPPPPPPPPLPPPPPPTLPARGVSELLAPVAVQNPHQTMSFERFYASL